MQLVAELFRELFRNAWLGIAAYLLRASLVVAYSLAVVPIGGPNVDASVVQWIPFFAADFPWSLLFDGMNYSSNARALTVYAFVVGIPWIVYGVIFQQCLALLSRRFDN